jgi:succinyl-CoA synthetase beta subunit
MYSTEGGMDIEEVAEHTSFNFYRRNILVGLQGFQARRIAFNLGLFWKCFQRKW